MDHHCHARGCMKPVKPELLMCFPHWSMVPRKLQLAVWAAYRPGQCDDMNPSEAWHRAADAAIAAVAEVGAARRRPQPEYMPGSFDVSTTNAEDALAAFERNVGGTSGRFPQRHRGSPQTFTAYRRSEPRARPPPREPRPKEWGREPLVTFPEDFIRGYWLSHRYTTSSRRPGQVRHGTVLTAVTNLIPCPDGCGFLVRDWIPAGQHAPHLNDRGQFVNCRGKELPHAP